MANEFDDILVKDIPKADSSYNPKGKYIMIHDLSAPDDSSTQLIKEDDLLADIQAQLDVIKGSIEVFTNGVVEGGSVQLKDNTTIVVINPAAPVINFTIKLPVNPYSKQRILILLGGTIAGGNPVITNSLNIVSPNPNYPIVYVLPADMVYSGDCEQFDFVNNTYYNLL